MSSFKKTLETLESFLCCTERKFKPMHKDATLKDLDRCLEKPRTPRAPPHHTVGEEEYETIPLPLSEFLDTGCPPPPRPRLRAPECPPPTWQGVREEEYVTTPLPLSMFLDTPMNVPEEEYVIIPLSPRPSTNVRAAEHAREEAEQLNKNALDEQALYQSQKRLYQQKAMSVEEEINAARALQDKVQHLAQDRTPDVLPKLPTLIDFVPETKAVRHCSVDTASGGTPRVVLPSYYASEDASLVES